jgi:hypothetical protein
VGYIIGAVILIFVIVEVIRLIIHILTRIMQELGSVADGIAHAAAAAVSVLASVAPWIALAIVATGLLWAACWLAAEVWYLVRDRRAEQEWFAAIGPRIALAMSPGGPYALANLVAPRPPAFGRGADHPLTPPIPRPLQRLVDAGTRAAGLSPAPDAVPQPESADDAVTMRASSPVTRVRASRQRTTTRTPEEGRASVVLHGLRASEQLDRVREFVEAGTYVSVSRRVIREPSGNRQRADDPVRTSHMLQNQRRVEPKASLLGEGDGAGNHRDIFEEAAAERKGRVIVDGSVGVQVGSRNRQLNFYTWEVVTPKIEDLAKRLNDPDVRKAAARLAANPADAAARRSLLNALAPGGLRLGGPTTRLRVTALRAGPAHSGSWLNGTVLFRDVSHGQVGAGNTQRNNFVYAVAPDNARRILAGHRDLAKALIDCAFPERGRGNFARLGRTFKSALEGTRVKDDGRIRSEHYKFPAPGETLHIRAHDGVSVGPGSTITRHDEVIARPVSGIRARSVLDRTLSARGAASSRTQPEKVSRLDPVDRAGIHRPGPAGGMFTR